MSLNSCLSFGLSRVAAVGIGLAVGGLVGPGAIAQTPPNAPALFEPTENDCVLLQEVDTGTTEVRRRIENRRIARNNWHLDFLVPNQPTFSYFVALFTPEHTAPYWMDMHLRQSHGGSEKVFSAQVDGIAGSTIAIPFQSPTGRQPAVVNARTGGVNGNVYTLSIAACE